MTILDDHPTGWLLAAGVGETCLGIAPPAPWTQLPPALARRLHFTTADLPGIPAEADSLRDIRDWPATMVFDGVRYRLKTLRGHWDVGGPIDPSVRDPGACTA